MVLRRTDGKRAGAKQKSAPPAQQRKRARTASDRITEDLHRIAKVQKREVAAERRRSSGLDSYFQQDDAEVEAGGASADAGQLHATLERVWSEGVDLGSNDFWMPNQLEEEFRSRTEMPGVPFGRHTSLDEMTEEGGGDLGPLLEGPEQYGSHLENINYIPSWGAQYTPANQYYMYGHHPLLPSTLQPPLQSRHVALRGLQIQEKCVLCGRRQLDESSSSICIEERCGRAFCYNCLLTTHPPGGYSMFDNITRKCMVCAYQSRKRPKTNPATWHWEFHDRPGNFAFFFILYAPHLQTMNLLIHCGMLYPLLMGSSLR